MTTESTGRVLGLTVEVQQTQVPRAGWAVTVDDVEQRVLIGLRRDDDWKVLVDGVDLGSVSMTAVRLG